MTIEAHYDTSAHMIIIRVVADVTAENIKLTVQKGLELSTQHNCNNMLFDIRQCAPAQPEAQGFFLMENAQKNLGLLPKHSVAIVYNPSLYPTERATFIENVTANRPNPTLRMFTDIHAAVTWPHNKK